MKLRWPESTQEPPANGSTWMHPAGFATEAQARDWGRLCVKWDVVELWQDRFEMWHLRLRRRSA